MPRSRNRRISASRSPCAAGEPPLLQIVGQKFILGTKSPDMDLEIHRMRRAHAFRGGQGFRDADRIGVGRDLGQVAQLVFQQLHQGQAGHAAQLPQVGRIEGLDEHRAAVRRIAVALQGIEDGLFLRQTDARRNAPDAWSRGRRRSRAPPRRRLASAANCMISSKVGTENRPSKAQFCGRNSGSRSRARKVLISARVKSSVNHPVMVSPSMIWVRRRAANSGCWATSVVPPISFSCRAMSTPSRVMTKSGSI